MGCPKKTFSLLPRPSTSRNRHFQYPFHRPGQYPSRLSPSRCRGHFPGHSPSACSSPGTGRCTTTMYDIVGTPLVAAILPVRPSAQCIYVRVFLWMMAALLIVYLPLSRARFTLARPTHPVAAELSTK